MICPRCDNDKAYQCYRAKDNSWELFRCPNCYFVWRSTEEPEVTDPGLYDPRFKLSAKIIMEMKEKPPIPPLLEK